MGEYHHTDTLADVSPMTDFDLAVEECVELAGAIIRKVHYGVDNLNDFLEFVDRRPDKKSIMRRYAEDLHFAGLTLAEIHLLPEVEEVM